MKEVGSAVKVAQPGDPVILSFTFCNDCPICKAGHYSHCEKFEPLNFGGTRETFGLDRKLDISGSFFGQSSFAQQTVVKQTTVVNVKGLVRDREELQLFAPLGCGVRTGSGTVVNVAKAAKDDIVCIMGLGGVGLSAVMAAKIRGCNTVIGVDKIESRLELAKELGATQIVNGGLLGDKSLVDAIKEVAEGVGPSVTIDTTGAPPIIKAGFDATRNRWKFIQVGTPPFDFNFELHAFSCLVRGIEYSGAIGGHSFPPEYVPKMIQWYREGKFPVGKLIKLMPADDFEKAVAEMKDGTTIKPVLCW